MKQIRLSKYMIQYAARSRKDNTYKARIRNNARKIKEFEKFIGKDLYTEDFDERMMEEYDYFLRSLPQNYRWGTINTFGKKAVEFLKKASKEGYKIDLTCTNYKFPPPEITTIALTEEEIERIFNLKRLSEAQKTVRFWFILSCCTGLRYSDASRVQDANFYKDKISIRTQKTNTQVVIPMHHMVKSLLKEYKGEFPVLKSQTNFNKVVKNLCKRAKINDKILIERHEGNKFIRKTVQKWKMVSHHTGRRTFATNAYLSGIPVARIMLLTGHKTETAFFMYIKIDKTQNAILLSQHRFFTG